MNDVATAMINNASMLDKIGTIGILIFMCMILLYLLRDKGKLEQTLTELKDIQARQLDITKLWSENAKQREQLIMRDITDKIDNSERMLREIIECCKDNTARLKFGRRKEIYEED